MIHNVQLSVLVTVRVIDHRLLESEAIQLVLGGSNNSANLIDLLEVLSGL